MGNMKRMKKYLAPIALGFVLTVAGVVLFNHSNIMASIDNYSKVEVTAEVKPSCTNSEMLYTEECLKRITDGVATSLAELVAQEKVVEEQTKILDTKREAFNQAVFNLETVANN